MVAIVAHHYVVNSGLIDTLKDTTLNASSCIMLLFGAWGKTGINCFMLITGYFMCKMSFSWRKQLKLYIQIIFYAVVIYAIFCFTGHEKLSFFQAAFKLFPIQSVADGFTSCFLIFYLLIPFLNILVRNMDKRLHSTLHYCS